MEINNKAQEVKEKNLDTSGETSIEKEKSIPELVYEIITNSSDGEPPIQARIVDKVLEYKNSTLKNDWQYTKESVQPNICRALKKLIKDEKIVRLDNNSYVPFTLENRRRLVRRSIIECVSFNREDIFIGSATMVIVDVKREDMYIARKLFLEYLGNTNCYDILDINDKLLLLLTSQEKDSKDKKRDLKKMRDDVKAIVKEAYNIPAEKKHVYNTSASAKSQT